MTDNPMALQHAGPVPGKKYFSLAEALRALPLVKRIAGDIQSTQSRRLQIHAELSSGQMELAPARQEALQEEFDRESQRLENLIGELTHIGVELKDPARGLLDFPSVHEGREILLCWKGDEATITSWHELDSGFSGRKSVSMLHDKS